jgi:hypothetical protein
MRGRIALLGGLLAVAFGSAGAAAEPTPLQSFLGSAAYRELIDRAFSALPAAIFRKCPSLAVAGSQVTVLRAVSFAPNGKPNGGLWRHTFPVKGCGNDTTVNLFFWVAPDERITTLFGIPGATHADLTLQRDAMPFADAGAGVVTRDCKAFIVIDSRFEGYGVAHPPIADPGPGAPGRPWWETWTLSGCDQLVEVPIDFVPDAKGTQIVQPGGARALSGGEEPRSAVR